MSKAILFIGCLLTLASCGSDYIVAENHAEVAQKFEGVYFLSNNSFIEIVQDHENKLALLRKGQSLNSVNPENGTLGTFPILSDDELLVFNGVVRFSKDVNFDSSRHDIEEDQSGANINGRRRVDVELRKTAAGIRIRIQVYANRSNDNINWVVVDRVLESI